MNVLHKLPRGRKAALCGLLIAAPLSPLSASASGGGPNTGPGSDSERDDPITIMVDRCEESNDSPPAGAKGCFLDNFNGNDDVLKACDIHPGGSGFAHVTIWEKHWYGWTHEASEDDGADAGCDYNYGFNIGNGNLARLRVCIEYPDQEDVFYGCDNIYFTE